MDTTFMAKTDPTRKPRRCRGKYRIEFLFLPTPSSDDFRKDTSRTAKAAKDLLKKMEAFA